MSVLLVKVGCRMSTVVEVKSMQRSKWGETGASVGKCEVKVASAGLRTSALGRSDRAEASCAFSKPQNREVRLYCPI